MLAALPPRMFPDMKERFMGQEDTSANAPLSHAELWGGMERDLERLQGVIDGAVEELTRSFSGMLEASAKETDAGRLREKLGVEARRAITCLQFHDLASQMIANLRGRAELLEMAALAAAPGSLVEERSRLLTDALRLTRSRPGTDADKSGDVELF